MEKLIRMENVTKIFKTAKREQVVLRNLNLHVNRGEVVCLLGPSGSGKSTCLRSINALETISGGHIEVCGIDYQKTKLPVHEIRRNTAMVFQKFELFPHLTAMENVALGPRYVQKMSRKKALLRAEELLVEVGLKEHLKKYPAMLSGGQQQRVGIARALAGKAQVLLCDEPTSALDPELVDEVTEILLKVAKSGMTMVVVTHQMSFAKAVGGRCLFLEEGIILEEGPTETFFANPQSKRLQQFLQKVHT